MNFEQEKADEDNLQTPRGWQRFMEIVNRRSNERLQNYIDFIHEQKLLSL